ASLPIHMEGRRLFCMKRAQPFRSLARPPQPHVPGDVRFDVDAVFDLLYQTVREARHVDTPLRPNILLVIWDQTGRRRPVPPAPRRSHFSSSSFFPLPLFFSQPSTAAIRTAAALAPPPNGRPAPDTASN